MVNKWNGKNLKVFCWICKMPMDKKGVKDDIVIKKAEDLFGNGDYRYIHKNICLEKYEKSE